MIGPDTARPTDNAFGMFTILFVTEEEEDVSDVPSSRRSSPRFCSSFSLISESFSFSSSLSSSVSPSLLLEALLFEDTTDDALENARFLPPSRAVCVLLRAANPLQNTNPSRETSKALLVKLAH